MPLWTSEIRSVQSIELRVMSLYFSGYCSKSICARHNGSVSQDLRISCISFTKSDQSFALDPGTVFDTPAPTKRVKLSSSFACRRRCSKHFCSVRLTIIPPLLIARSTSKLFSISEVFTLNDVNISLFILIASIKTDFVQSLCNEFSVKSQRVPERGGLCNEFSVKSQRVPERGGS